MEKNEVFPIPMWAAWVVNIVSWLIFSSTDLPALEIVMGIACLFAAFVAFKHKSWYLLDISLLDANWMLLCGFDVDLLKLLL